MASAHFAAKARSTAFLTLDADARGHVGANVGSDVARDVHRRKTPALIRQRAPPCCTGDDARPHRLPRRRYYKNRGSRFAYGAYRSAGALLDAAAGRLIVDREPSQLPDAVLNSARLQAVKCVPKRRNSKPTDPMWEGCPPMLLASELDILRPDRIFVTGADPRIWGVETIDGYRTVRCRAGDLWRGTLTRPGYQAQVYGVVHPAYYEDNRNDRSERALLRHLASTATAR